MARQAKVDLMKELVGVMDPRYYEPFVKKMESLMKKKNAVSPLMAAMDATKGRENLKNFTYRF